MTVSRENMLSRQQPLQVKVHLLLRSESVNCLARCLVRVNIIFTYNKQRRMAGLSLRSEKCDEATSEFLTVHNESRAL